MRIAFQVIAHDPVQDVDLSLYLASDVPDAGDFDRPREHHAWLRGIVRDGSALTIGLSLTECAELYLRLHNDDGVRTWAETLSARLAGHQDEVHA